MGDDEAVATHQPFPVWRALSLLEEFVTYSWRDGAPRPLDALHSFSRLDLAPLVETFETIFVATHHCSSLLAALPGGNGRQSVRLPRDVDDRSEKVEAILDESASLRVKTEVALGGAGDEDASLAKATWALREFLSYIDCFVASLNFGDDVSLEGMEQRLSSYRSEEFAWLKRAGETIAAACGLVLLEVEHLATL